MNIAPEDLDIYRKAQERVVSYGVSSKKRRERYVKVFAPFPLFIAIAYFMPALLGLMIGIIVLSLALFIYCLWDDYRERLSIDQDTATVNKLRQKYKNNLP